MPDSPALLHPDLRGNALFQAFNVADDADHLAEIGVRFQLNLISDDCMKLKLGERTDERDAALLLLLI